MNIKLEQLPSQLAKSLTPIYLLTGNEMVLLNNACDTIWQAAHRHGFHERRIITAETGFNWTSLLLTLNNYSLFSEKKYIEIQLIDHKLTAPAIQFLLDYCQTPPADTLLLLKMGKIESSSQKAKWYQAISQTGTIITIYPLNNTQLPHWISQYAQTLGLTLSTDALRLLANHVEGNLIAAQQEIQKLHLIYGSRAISIAELTEVLIAQYRYDIFALVQEALQKKSTRVVRILQQLREADTEPTLILWALTKELRTLALIAHQLQQGSNFNTLCQKHAVWPQHKPIVQFALKNRSAVFFKQLLQYARKIDELIKTTQSSSIWDNLLSLSLALTDVNLCTNNR